MAIIPLNVTENYQALKILRQVHLNTAMTSIETYLTTYFANNMEQLRLDIFDPSYTYDNDGLNNLDSPIYNSFAKLGRDDHVTGSWTFEQNVAFENPVTHLSTISSSGQMRARVWRVTSNQSIPDATETVLSFLSETYDVGAMHDNSTNPSRLTIPAGGSGIYKFHAQARFASNATGRREMHIYKNGSKIASYVSPTASAGFDSFLQISADDSASVGDYYEVYVYQNSGGALDVVLGERATYFSAMKVW